jgi:hypothetical protein
MTLNKQLLSAAVAAALAMGGSLAQAGTLAITGGTDTFANEIFQGATPETVVSPAYVATYTTAVNINADFLVDVTLQDGAEFAVALTSGDLVYGGAGTSTVVLLSGGGIGDTTAQFRVFVGITPPVAAETFALTYTVDNMQSLATAGATQGIEFNLNDTLASVDSVEEADFATSVNGTTPTVAAAGADGLILLGASTAGACDNYECLDADGAPVGGPYTVVTVFSPGTAQFVDSGAGTEDDGATAWAAGAGDATATGSATLNGDFTSATRACIDISGNGACLDPTDVALTINGGLTSATGALTNANVVALAAAANFLVEFNGIGQINAQSFSGALDITYDNYGSEGSGTTALVDLDREGSERRIWNVPVTDVSSSDAARIRVYNRGSTPGQVFINAWGADGVQVCSNDSLIASLGAGEVQTIRSTDIQTACGVGTWSGRLYGQLIGEFENMEVQALMRTPSGDLVNMSSVARDEE